MPLPHLPAAPRDSAEAAVWIGAAAGAYEDAATVYRELVACIEQHRAEGVIR